MKAIILIAVTISVVTASPTLHQHWANFKATFQKEYQSEAEEAFRLEIFNKNLQEINVHNELYERGLVTYKQKINSFSDLTNEEYRKYKLGLKIPKGFVHTGKPFIAPENIKLPDKLNWTDLGAVSDVKDQESCGSCWAFSTTGAIEGQLRLKKNNTTPVSEQNLVDCAKSVVDNLINDGCNGGFQPLAYDYVINNTGIDSEASYPYEGRDRPCRFTVAGNVTSQRSYTYVQSGNETDLLAAVATLGPVAVAIDASFIGFAYYDSGVYYQEGCAKGLDDVNDLDHAVLVVGYGTENGTDYWLVKNSWGKYYGDHGYLKMARNRDNNCGIATYATVPFL